MCAVMQPKTRIRVPFGMGSSRDESRSPTQSWIRWSLRRQLRLNSGSKAGGVSGLQHENQDFHFGFIRNGIYRLRKAQFLTNCLHLKVCESFGTSVLESLDIFLENTELPSWNSIVMPVSCLCLSLSLSLSRCLSSLS